MRYIFLICFLPFFVFGDQLVYPLPKVVYNKQKAALGERLFLDPSLSKDSTVSCADCHSLSRYGVDNKEFSTGIGGAKGGVNSPTVYNAVFNFVQFWDGRAKTLKDQAKGPLLNKVEMGNTEKGVVAAVEKNRYYAVEFKKIYKDGVTFDNIADSIAEFEKTLITYNSKFDRYLMGDKSALTKTEQEGFGLFKGKGCISCHNGVNLGGNMFQKLGVTVEYKDPKSNLGRYGVTKNEEDKYMYKVPSLRNVEMTAPYFHNGLVGSLKDAIVLMGEHQLGVEFTKKELERIEAFLKTLTGERPPRFVK